MSATMARQGGWVQLEQSDMRLARNMAKMAKGGFSRTTIEETQFLIKKPQAEVRDEKEHGVDFPGHNNVKAEMERNPAMLWENQTDGWITCQNGTAHNPPTLGRRIGTGVPPPERLRKPTTEPMPHPPKTPSIPPGNNEGAHLSEIKGAPPGFVYIHTPLPSAQCFNFDAYAKHWKCDTDCNPDLLTEEGTSTG